MGNVDDDDVRRPFEQGRTFSDIADAVGCAPSAAYRRAQLMGLRSSFYDDDGLRFPRLHDADWLRERFEDGEPIAEVADEIGVSYGAVVAARQRFGISRPRTRTGAIDVDEVRRRWRRENRSARSAERWATHRRDSLRRCDGRRRLRRR